MMLIYKHVRSKKDGDEHGLPTTDVFLLGVIAAWGATIDANEHTGLAGALVTQVMDLWQDVVLEPDSVSKFLVCSIPLVTSSPHDKLVNSQLRSLSSPWSVPINFSLHPSSCTHPADTAATYSCTSP
jgi:hypothetical protein